MKKTTKRNEPEKFVLAEVNEPAIGERMRYTEQYRAARQLMRADAVYPADVLADMSDGDVEEALNEHYARLGYDDSNEVIRIVRRKDIPKLREIMIEIRR